MITKLTITQRALMPKESEESEVKDIKWAKEEIKKERNRLNDKRYEREVDDLTTGVLLGLKKALNTLNQLDEPEVLSQDWIDEHRKSYTMEDSVEISDLQNLLVPKQEDADQAYKDGYEKGKEHATRDDEPETVASVMADFFRASARLKEVLAMEVEEMENDDN